MTDDEDDPADETPADPDDDPPAGDGDREGPLGDVAADVDTADRPPSPAEELFDDADAVEVDREALWRQVAGEEVAERVAEDESAGPATGGPTVRRPGATTTGEGSTAETGRHARVVEKSKYCHGCPHFSPPPDVHCNHEGTEIAEMVDVEHFKLVDCPIVKEDEELENVR